VLPGILSEFRSLPGYKELLRRLPRRQSGLSVCGLPGSSPVVMLATLAEDFPLEPPRTGLAAPHAVAQSRQPG